MAELRLAKVDDELWRRVKVCAATRGITVRELMLKALEFYLEQGGPNPEPQQDPVAGW